MLVTLFGAGVWRAVDPPARVVVRELVARDQDFAAAAFATRFARAYLSFAAEDPQARTDALAELDGGRDGATSSGYLAGTGSRTVERAEVTQATRVPQGTRYVVAAETQPDGLIDLAVTVRRDPRGALQVVGFPAIVGSPLVTAAEDDPSGPAVDDEELAAVVTRALRNYLAGRVDDLLADLAPDAVVSVPGVSLRLGHVSELRWEPGVRDSVLATVLATDRHGSQLTLTYELALRKTPTRWFVNAIHTNPTGR